MNVGASACVSMGGLFLVMAVVFALLKEKGAILIGGFNTMTKNQRDQYDKSKMSKDMRNSLFCWSAIFAVGALLCQWLGAYMAFLAFAVWAVVFFKEVHFDAEKAFQKYKLGVKNTQK